MKKILILLFITITTLTQPLAAIDWSAWKIGGQSVQELPIWNATLVEVKIGKDYAKESFIKNVGKSHNLMKISSTARGLQLKQHKLFQYSTSDWKRYTQQEPEAKKEQARLGGFLNSQIRQYPSNTALIKSVEKHFRRLADLTKSADWVKKLQSNFIAARLGISGKAFRTYPDFEDFVRNNYLYKHVLVHQHSVQVDDSGEPFLLVEGEEKPWSVLRDELELDKKGRLTSHFYTYQGLVPGQPHSVLVPFKKIPAETYSGRHLLEIVTVTGFPPHAWVRLINPEGEVYSVGYWGATPLTNLFTTVAHVIKEEGRVLAPDLFEITANPRDMQTTLIGLTPEQFAQVMDFTRDYQANPDACYQILDFNDSQNCAGFVQSLADEVGIYLRASSWMMPFNNPYSINDWQKEIKTWRKKQLKKLRKDPSATKEEREKILFGLPQ